MLVHKGAGGECKCRQGRSQRTGPRRRSATYMARRQGDSPRLRARPTWPQGRAGGVQAGGPCEGYPTARGPGLHICTRVTLSFLPGRSED